MIAHNHWGTWRAHHLLILVEHYFFEHCVTPLNATGVHDRVEFNHPLIKRVFRKSSWEHVFVDLFLVLYCLRVVLDGLRMCLHYLVDLLSVDRPVLEGTGSNVPLIVLEVLFSIDVFLFVINIQVNFINIDIEVPISPICSLWNLRSGFQFFNSHFAINIKLLFLNFKLICLVSCIVTCILRNHHRRPMSHLLRWIFP